MVNSVKLQFNYFVLILSGFKQLTKSNAPENAVWQLTRCCKQRRRTKGIVALIRAKCKKRTNAKALKTQQKILQQISLAWMAGSPPAITTCMSYEMSEYIFM
jgi:hypothetical protein